MKARTDPPPKKTKQEAEFAQVGAFHKIGAKKEEENEDNGYTDIGIIESIEGMVRQLVFLAHPNENAIRVVGEFGDDDFDPKAVTIIQMETIAMTIDGYVQASKLLLEEDKVVRGLYVLKKAEALINFAQASDPMNKYLEYLVVISNNIACFMMKFNLPGLALEYLNRASCFASSFITSERIRMQSYRPNTDKLDIYQLTVQLQQRMVFLKLSLKISVLLSDGKRHGEALQIAREAVSESLSMILDLQKLTLVVLLKLESLKVMKVSAQQDEINAYFFSSKDYDSMMIKDQLSVMDNLKRIKRDIVMESTPRREATELEKSKSTQPGDIFGPIERRNYDSIRRTLPVLFELEKDLKDTFAFLRKDLAIEELSNLAKSAKRIKLFPIDMSYIFTSLNMESSIINKNILEIVSITMMDLSEMGFLGNQDRCFQELSTTSCVEKFCVLVLSMYCMSTEKYFVEIESSGMMSKGMLHQPYRIPDSEVDLGKTLEIAYKYIPHKTPLCLQVFSVFEKTQQTANQLIPEDEEIESTVKLVKPLNGGTRTDFFIPLIRDNKRKIQNLKFSRKRAISVYPNSVEGRSKLKDLNSTKSKTFYPNDTIKSKHAYRPHAKTAMTVNNAEEFRRKIENTVFNFKKRVYINAAKLNKRNNHAVLNNYSDGGISGHQKVRRVMNKRNNQEIDPNFLIAVKTLLPLKGLPKHRRFDQEMQLKRNSSFRLPGRQVYPDNFYGSNLN